LVRGGDDNGDALRRIGASAEPFDDHTALQLGAAGSYQGVAFTLVGRLQYRSADGTWNEWHALFDAARSGWLSEDNGRYVLAFERPLDAAPEARALTVGAAQSIEGQVYNVASVTTATLIAAQGELPSPPVTDRSFSVADLRNTRGEVGTLDYSDAAAPRWSVGSSVQLADLRMTGLADTSQASEKTLVARNLACPSCGAAMQITLASTLSIACAQCKAVVDVSALPSNANGNAAAALAHYAQDNPQVDGGAPLIPLGTVGRIAFTTATVSPPAPLSWQVVGYVERCEVETSADEDQVFWREYLLYHRTAGFTFLIDADDGWSWVAPITGVPERFGDSVKLGGVLYRKLYSYSGKVTYVLGEFYWRLQRDQTTHNIDYRGDSAAPTRRLNREQTTTDGGQEVVWSAGATLSADAVRAAFRLPTDQLARLERDPTPLTGSGSLSRKLIFVVLVFLLLLMLLRCGGSNSDNSNCADALSTFGPASQEYQSCAANARSGSSASGGYGGGWGTSGGSYGGYSTGGGHK
jgi:uncharacterized membrane protein YgcG